jgi:hypothetical protein
MLKTAGWQVGNGARCDRTIEDNPGTFQQALCAGFS